MSSQPDSSVRRVAIKKENYFHILYQLNNTQSLQETVKEICSKWQLQRPEQYALQYLDSKIYITNDNRDGVRDGDILTVVFNIEFAASKFLSDIEQPDISVKRKALNDLAGVDNAGQADDPLFAREFINRNGITALVNIIENPGVPHDIIAQSMAALQELLEHGFVSWDQSISQMFLERILDFANNGGDPRITEKALALLDNIVTVSSTLFILVMNKVVLQNIVNHMKSNDPKLQLSAISLINSILTRMENENRKKFTNDLNAKGYPDVLKKIISSSQLSSDMNHQLYAYQMLLLSLLEPRLNTKPDPQDSRLNMMIVSMYNTAFESSSTASKDRMSERPDFKKLGFENSDAPIKDFEECPPGYMACDVMMYFAEKHRDQYIKFIVENFVRDDEYQCPFAKCTKYLTKMLAELLNVGAPISDTSEDYQPILFSSPHMFEELFCVTVQLLNKTWKEMRATAADFNRVISVVKDQVKRVLKQKPETIDKLKNQAFSLSYQQILRLMQQEAQERIIVDSQTKPVKELREQIEPEIRELVRQQRLAQLVDGEFFRQVFKGKFKSEKFMYCCLSPNHRFLHYAKDLPNKDDVPSFDSLPQKLPLADVTKLELGKDCAHLKNMKKFVPLSFSLFYGQEEMLDFVALNEQILSVWTDALFSLLGKEMISKSFQDDLDMLLNMEMKLLLLDLEEVNIPEVPPPIPNPPDNYNFYYSD